MPPKYREWKKAIAEYVKVQHPRKQLVRPLRMVIHFRSEETFVELTEFDTDFKRAKYVTGDIDNMLGGVLDALEDSGLIANDKQVVHVVAVVGERK